jgi:uncharacterized protein (DUF58 family)
MFIHYWRRFWSRAPRQLRLTTSGKVMIGVAFAAGIAAANTGNNLLFLGWGLVLNGIVLSGLLSEGSVRYLEPTTLAPTGLRVGQSHFLEVNLHNQSNWLSAYHIKLILRLVRHKKKVRIGAPIQFKVPAASQEVLKIAYTPSRRGLHRVLGIETRTLFPFGFFEKIRRHLQKRECLFWVAPERVKVDSYLSDLSGQQGYLASGKKGSGDDFFGLRLFKEGEDPRNIYWKKSLSTERLVVREYENHESRALILELHMASKRHELNDEHCIAVWASLGESLLAQGLKVGFIGPGLNIAAQSGVRQRDIMLYEMARLDCTKATLPPQHRSQIDRICLVGPRASSQDINMTSIQIAPPLKDEVT